MRSKFALLCITGLLLPALAHADCFEDWHDAPLHQDWQKPSPECFVAIARRYAALHPNTVEIHDLGQSERGHPLVALRLSQDVHDPTSRNRPSTLVIGGIHGAEEGASRTVVDWLRFLLEEPNAWAFENAGGFAIETNADLLASNQVWIVLQGGPEFGSFPDVKLNENGVNIDRNFGYLWFRDAATSGPVQSGLVPRISQRHGPLPMSSSGPSRRPM